MATKKEKEVKKEPKKAKKDTKQVKAKPAKEKKPTKARKSKVSDMLDDEEDPIESLDSIKKRLLKKAQDNGGEIEQAEIDEATQKLDLSDADIEGLIEYFSKKKIKVISDSDEEGIDEIDFGEGDADDLVEMSDEDVPDEKELNDISNLIVGDVKVNDSVKIYLKEIGKVRLSPSASRRRSHRS